MCVFFISHFSSVTLCLPLPPPLSLLFSQAHTLCLSLSPSSPPLPFSFYVSLALLHMHSHKFTSFLLAHIAEIKNQLFLLKGEVFIPFLWKNPWNDMAAHFCFPSWPCFAPAFSLLSPLFHVHVHCIVYIHVHLYNVQYLSLVNMPVVGGHVTTKCSHVTTKWPIWPQLDVQVMYMYWHSCTCTYIVLCCIVCHWTSLYCMCAFVHVHVCTCVCVCKLWSE